VAVAPHRWRSLPPDAPISIGVALDDATPESREALAMAARLAAAAHAPLRLVSVVHQPSPAHPMFAATGTSYARWAADARRAAEHHVHEALEAVAPDAGAGVLILDGDPVEQLAHVSRRLDLLLLGSRRYGPLRTALLGGVSSPLIEQAACPLLIVPRGVAVSAPEHRAERATAALDVAAPRH
jgi:nucleotide-binding universal stress UspA family protein